MGNNPEYKPRLPSVPSELIELALRDLELTEADDRYRVNMDRWHELDGEDVCHVCLAGAVMAQTLQLDPGDNIAPYHYSPSEDGGRLLALDDIRTNNWTTFLSRSIKPEPVPHVDMFAKLSPTYTEYEVLLMGDALRTSRERACRDVRKKLLDELYKLGPTPIYASHPEAFKCFMGRVAETLKKEGY